MKETPQVFAYGAHTIHAIIVENETWFVASDVCLVLGIGNVSMAVNGNEKTGNIGVDADEKDNIMIHDVLGRQHETLCVNESGLYALIFKSRKPEAKAFKRWVTQEVLPSIRKTGSYSVKPRKQFNNMWEERLWLFGERNTIPVGY